MADLAKKLNNPAASLISLPIRTTFDFGGGPNDDGFQHRLNSQPVIPFELNDDWKILLRTIVPYVNRADKPSGGPDWGLRFSVTFVLPK